LFSMKGDEVLAEWETGQDTVAAKADLASLYASANVKPAG